MKKSAILLFLLSLVGCASNWPQVAERRAKFDLNCEEVQVTKLDGSTWGGFGRVATETYGAKGCGKTVTYLVKCSGTCGLEKEAIGSEK